jgi:oligogalacturonide lyase
MTRNSLGGSFPTSQDSIYTIVCDSLKSEKLVNMKYHNYNLEPNVHFSPDDKWIIFRANFEGFDNVYAVEL